MAESYERPGRLLAGAARAGPWRRAAGVLIVALLVPVATASCGRRLRFDAERIESKCGVTQELELSREQARCVARLAGLRDGRKCPLELKQVDDGAGGDEVWQIRESCGAMGLQIAARDGRVVAVELGKAGASSEPARPEAP